MASDIIARGKISQLNNTDIDIANMINPMPYRRSSITPILFDSRREYTNPSGLVRYSSTLAVTVKKGVFLIGDKKYLIGNNGLKRPTHCIKNDTSDMIKDPEIHVENGVYYAFFTGIDGSNDWEIQYATASTIEGTWTYQGTALTRVGKPSAMGDGPWAPTFAQKNGTWYMFVTDGTKTFRATASSLGGTWTWDATFSVASAMDWHVTKVGDIWYAFESYGGMKYRTSADLDTWSTTTTIATNTQDWCSTVFEAPFYVEHAGKHFVFYGGADSKDGQRIGILYADSITGTYVDAGQIDICVPEASWKAISHPALINVDDVWYLFFCGTNGTPNGLTGGAVPFRIYRYKSTDLTSWTPVDYDTSIVASTDEIAVITKNGDIELTTEDQNQSFYQLARIKTNGSDITQIDNLLPYFYQGEALPLLNGGFLTDIASWTTFNDSGTVTQAFDNTVYPLGFASSAKFTAATASVGGLRQDITNADIRPGDLILLQAMVKNTGGTNAKLTLHIWGGSTLLCGRDDTVTGTFPWQTLACIIRVPTRVRHGNTSPFGDAYHGAYKLRVQLNSSINSGQSVNYANVKLTVIRGSQIR